MLLGASVRVPAKLILESLGMAHVQAGRVEEALAYHRQALAIRQEDGDVFGEAMALNSIGLVHLRGRALTSARSEAYVLLELAQTQLASERYEEALLSFRPRPDGARFANDRRLLSRSGWTLFGGNVLR